MLWRGIYQHSFNYDMEKISSRKNEHIKHMRLLSSDSHYRYENGLYICDGIKFLKEALSFGAEIKTVMWKEKAEELQVLQNAEQFMLPADLFDYVSPMKNSPGPLFSVKMPERESVNEIKNAVVLENLQDPGNVGTVIRTANAFGIGAVILTGNCADVYNPKTVRATMGAIFRQNIITVELEKLPAFLKEKGLPLYCAALSDRARDCREIKLKEAAVAVGSEGQGLSKEILSMCNSEIIIPMQPQSESLNAAVAASVLMWEMSR